MDYLARGIYSPVVADSVAILVVLSPFSPYGPLARPWLHSNPRDFLLPASEQELPSVL